MLACFLFFQPSCIVRAQVFDETIESGAPSADFMIAYFDDFGVLVAAEIRDVGYVPLDKLSDSFRAFLSDEVSPSGTGTAQAYGGLADMAFGPPPIPTDPATPPAPGWEWRPPQVPVGEFPGNWYNPGTGESLNPDLNHLPPKGPHWGWTDPYGNKWYYFPDTGQWKPNPKAQNPRRPQPVFPPGTVPIVEVPPVFVPGVIQATPSPAAVAPPAAPPSAPPL